MDRADIDFFSSGNGTWTYIPALSETLVTTIFCDRPKTTVWWLQSLTVQSELWLVLFVPVFSIAISIFNKARIDASTLAITTIITSVGYGANWVVSRFAPNFAGNGIVGESLQAFSFFLFADDYQAHLLLVFSEIFTREYYVVTRSTS